MTAPDPVSRPSRADTTEGRTEARETCRRSRCANPTSTRRVVLVGPDGTDRKRCGPYCNSCTDALLKNLTPTYTGGGAAYRIDREETDHA